MHNFLSATACFIPQAVVTLTLLDRFENGQREAVVPSTAQCLVYTTGARADLVDYGSLMSI